MPEWISATKLLWFAIGAIVGFDVAMLFVWVSFQPEFRDWLTDRRGKGGAPSEGPVSSGGAGSSTATGTSGR